MQQNPYISSFEIFLLLAVLTAFKKGEVIKLKSERHLVKTTSTTTKQRNDNKAKDNVLIDMHKFSVCFSNNFSR